MRVNLLMISLVYFISAILFSVVYGIGFEIPPGMNTPLCFYEAATEGSPIKVMFQVTHGGNLDVNVQISGPDGRSLYQGDGESTGRYSFNAHTTGLYSFCFGNQMSRVTSKTVQLEVSTSKPNTNPSSSPGTNSVLKNQIKYLQDATNAISGDYQYLKQREIMHLASMF